MPYKVGFDLSRLIGNAQALAKDFGEEFAVGALHQSVSCGNHQNMEI
jgi:hypothetical protein